MNCIFFILILKNCAGCGTTVKRRSMFQYVGTEREYVINKYFVKDRSTVIYITKVTISLLIYLSMLEKVIKEGTHFDLINWHQRRSISY